MWVPFQVLGSFKKVITLECSAYAVAGGLVSDLFKDHVDVKQGCVLSPVVFLIFTW